MATLCNLLLKRFSEMSLPTKIKFNNGNEAPVLGLGTCSPKPEGATKAIEDAIALGYRHIDCSPVYGTEKQVGVAIKSKIADGTVKREDLFVVSKLWSNYHKTENVEKALRLSLKDLDLEYIDMYLIHWPFAFEEGDNLVPTNPDGSWKLADTDYLDTWKGMEAVLEKGLAKNIGVSNFNSEQIDRLLKNCKVKPVVNQIEVHPYLTQKHLSKFCNDRGILVTAYSPLGSPNRAWAAPTDPKLLEDDKLVKISKKYKKSCAQIAIRYQIDRGHLVIPNSFSTERLQDNFKVFDFKLSTEDMATIDSMDIGFRGVLVPMDSAKSSLYWPFNIPF